MIITGSFDETHTTLTIDSPRGRRLFAGVLLSNLVDDDDFTLTFQREDGESFVNYATYNITKTSGVISINGTEQTLGEINFENVYVNNSHGVKFTITKNSSTWRTIPYWYEVST